jgi:hypothetical protein
MHKVSNNLSFMMGTYFLDAIFSERIKEEEKTQIDLWQLILIVDFRSVIQNPWMQMGAFKRTKPF